MYQWGGSNFTKDMFGSRPKTELFLVWIRTGPGGSLFWAQTLLSGPIQAVPVEGFCSVLRICSDPDQNQNILVRIRTGTKKNLDMIRTMATVPIDNPDPNQASILSGLLSSQG
jgi:hypothetical protein